MVNDIFGYDIETRILDNDFIFSASDSNIVQFDNNIYITYVKDITIDCGDRATQDLYLIKSNDYGETFSSPQMISNCINTNGPGYLKTHDIAVEGSNVYIVYKESETPQASDTDRIMVRVSHDNGNTFGSPINVLDSRNGACTLYCTNLDIAAKDNFVYIAYDYNIGIYFAMSDDYGNTFFSRTTYEPTSSVSPHKISNPVIAVSDNNVHIGWVDHTNIKMKTSHDNGYTFDPPAIMPLYGTNNTSWLANNPPFFNYDVRLSIVANGSHIYYSTGSALYPRAPYVVGKSDDYGNTFETILFPEDVKSMGISNNKLYVLALNILSRSNLEFPIPDIYNPPPPSGPVDFNFKLFESPTNGDTFEQISFLPADGFSGFYGSHIEKEKINFLYSSNPSVGPDLDLALSNDEGKSFELIQLNPNPPIINLDGSISFVTDNENNQNIIRLGYKGMSGANTLADLEFISIKEDNCHINHQDPNCPNSPPVAISTADPNPAIVDQPVILDATDSFDPDQGDQITNYQWDQIDSSGFNVILSDPSSPITAFVAPSKVPHSIAAGTNLPLKFGLTVTDNHGESSSNQVTIPVQCSEADIVEANTMRSELNNIIRNGWIPVGFIHSVDALQQWLSGMGGTIDLTNWLKTEPTVSSSANVNLQRFQQLTENTGPNAGQKLADVIRNVDKDGKTRTYLAKWDVDHKETLLTDVGNTLGSFKLRSEGAFTIQQIDKKSIQVSGQVTHRIIDDYNFNPDSPFNKYNILKKCNGAEDFINIAQWKHIVNSLQKPNMILKDLKDGTLPFVLDQ